MNKFKKNIINGKILLSTCYKTWIFLTEKEFKYLKAKRLNQNSELYYKLEKIGIITTNLNKPFSGSLKKGIRSSNEDLLFVIVLTLRCPNKCIYCHSSSKPLNAKGYDMDEKTAKAVVDFIFKSSSRNITIEFQGGEPLTNLPTLKFIVQYAKRLSIQRKKHLKLYLQTNLSLMNESILKFLIENKIEISTSLDGPKKVHDKNRLYLNGTSSYNDVIKWIKRMQNRNIKCGAVAVITKNSLPFAKEVVDEFANLKINFRMLPLKRISYASTAWDKIGYSAEEFNKFYKKAMDYLFKINLKGISLVETNTRDIIRNIVFGTNDFMCFREPCGAATSQIPFDCKGDIYACKIGITKNNFNFGNVKKLKNFSDLNKRSLAFIEKHQIKKCLDCSWSHFCGACKAHVFDKNDSIDKAIFEYDCKIKKYQLDYIFRLLSNSAYHNIITKWLRES